MTKEEEIQKNMKALDLTREEAEEMYLFDHDLIENEEVEELTEKAKSVKRYEQSDKKRKPTTRERKVDEEKKKILNAVAETVETFATINAIKTETEISFSFNGASYTLKLTKHRPPKKETPKNNVTLEPVFYDTVGWS